MVELGCGGFLSWDRFAEEAAAAQGLPLRLLLAADGTCAQCRAADPARPTVSVYRNSFGHCKAVSFLPLSTASPGHLPQPADVLCMLRVLFGVAKSSCRISLALLLPCLQCDAVPNCRQCSTSGACAACVAGYTLAGGICKRQCRQPGLCRSCEQVSADVCDPGGCTTALVNGYSVYRNATGQCSLVRPSLCRIDATAPSQCRDLLDGLCMLVLVCCCVCLAPMHCASHGVSC